MVLMRRDKDGDQNVHIEQVGAGSPHPLTTDPDNDHSPSWSPDGLTIAFLRRRPAGGGNEIWQIAPVGGTPRKVAEIRPRLTPFRQDHLAWCPDSSCVLVTDSPGASQDDAVFSVAIDAGQRRQLTFPKQARDVDPAISSDGRHLIFRRDTTPFSGRFYRLSLTARLEPEGNPVPVTSILSAGRAAWMPDSREVLFSWRGTLWRLDALSGGVPRRVPFVGDDSLMPVVARTAEGRQRLVYVRNVTDTNVWRIDVPAAGAQASSAAAIAIGSPLWRLPGDAGPAVKILDGVILGSFDVVDQGIYYIDQQAEGPLASNPSGGVTRLRFFDFATQQATTVATGLGAVTFGLSATPDGRTIFFSRVDASIDELMVAEDFR